MEDEGERRMRGVERKRRQGVRGERKGERWWGERRRRERGGSETEKPEQSFIGEPGCS